MKKIILSIITIMMAGFVIIAPVYATKKAEERCVLTSFIGNAKCNDKGEKGKGTLNCSCDKGDGDSVVNILKIVIDIMTIGIGVLGLIGITIVGTQYLTAGGNEEKTRKAKRRMFEIIIGLIAYVVIFAALQFLLPEFNGV